MKKKTFLYVLAALIFALGAFAIFKVTLKGTLAKASDEFNERNSEPVLGIYDRNQKISTESVRSIHHYFIKWFDSYEAELPLNFKSAIADTNDVLLTIEMWSKSDDNILIALSKGDYDKKIIKICSVLSQSNKNIYLRWNPEMEAPVHSFLWQWQSPELYIQAFRHFASLCKKNAPHAKIVWGPAGFPGDLEYWPNADVVDFASVTLESQSEHLSYKYPKGDSMPEIIKLKLHRLRFIDKPIFILGSPQVKKETFKEQWIETAAKEIKKDEGIIYGVINSSRQVDSIKNENTKKIILGVYDPNLPLAKQKEVKVEHLFADWNTVHDGQFMKLLSGVISRKHDVIMTMEPWKEKKRERDPEILKNIIEGKYDDRIRELYKIISSTKQTVYLRFAHEMEIPIERYAWQSKDPVMYIKAFRYVVNFNKEKPKNVRFVWGPAGDRASLEFWPGNDVVDYISVAIYGLPDKNITDHKKQESFHDIFHRKFYRMRFLNKPIFITEFGVKGPEEYQKIWLDDAAVTINKYPEIMGVCYFNLYDTPEAWGDIQAPNWSISENTFNHFTKTLLNGR
jgi:beta-mannanase